MGQSNIVFLELESESLKNNLFGDPSKRTVPVYLPPAYDAKSDRYPTIYFLIGWSGRGEELLAPSGVFSKSLPVSFDEQISQGKLKPFIGVFPDGSNKLGCSQYVNAGKNGRYMDYLCDEIVPLVDRTFRTHAQASFRGITGHSSGGFGSLATAMLRPEVFQCMISSAGDSFYEYVYIQVIPTVIAAIEKYGSVENFLQEYLSNPNPSGLLPSNETTAMMALCICACFLPNPNVPNIFADIYFDLKTGALIPGLWEKLLAWDPVRMVDQYHAALKKMKYIGLEAGLQDEYALQLGHRQLAKKFDQYQIKYELTEYPGKHGGHRYRFVQRAQKMLDQMYATLS